MLAPLRGPAIPAPLCSADLSRFDSLASVRIRFRSVRRPHIVSISFHEMRRRFSAGLQDVSHYGGEIKSWLPLEGWPIGTAVAWDRASLAR